MLRNFGDIIFSADKSGEKTAQKPERLPVTQEVAGSSPDARSPSELLLRRHAVPLRRPAVSGQLSVCRPCRYDQEMMLLDRLWPCLAVDAPHSPILLSPHDQERIPHRI